MDQQNRPQYNVLPSSTLALISLVAGILGFQQFPFWVNTRVDLEMLS